MTLRTRLLVFSIILALIPLGVAGQNMIHITEDELKSSANENLLNTANHIAQEIDDFYLSTWLTPLKLVKSAVENNQVDVPAKMSLLESGMSNVSDIVAIQINVQGFPNPLFVQKSEFSKKLTKDGLRPEDVLVVKDDAIRPLMKSKSGGTSEIRYVEKARLWMLSVSLPLELNGRPALLTAIINLANLKERITSNPFAKNGKITLADKSGSEIFNQLGPQPANETPLLAAALEMLKENNKSVGVKPYTKANGEEMLGGYSFPQSLDVAVLVEKDKAKAYLAVSQMKKNMIFWVLAGLVAAIIAAIIVAVGLTRPLRTLMGVAEKISSGDLSVNIPISDRRDEITQLSKAFGKMAVDLGEHIKQLTETTKAKERAESELKLARQIQQTFLPKKFISSARVDIGAACEPAREVGGDYYDFFRLDEDNYGLIIGDVSGKGIPASLFMAVSRTLLRVLSTQIREPGAMMKEFNDRLVGLDSGSNMFISVFYGVFNAKTHTLKYSNAGHNLPFVNKPREEKAALEMLPKMKTMLAGMMDGLEFMEAEVKMRRKGDAIILYTDGMTEAIDKEGVEYGDDRLEESLRKYHALTAQEICDRTIKDVLDFQTGMPQFDDMTMLVLKVK